jgi:hypothetical protein
MLKLIEEGDYELFDGNPLNHMVDVAKVTIHDMIEKLQLQQFHQYTLKVSNPRVPEMYGLPKIHKEGDKMRPIISNVNSPFQNVSKWLVKELRKLRSVEGFSIKNSVELCEKLKDVTVNQHEVLASFDVVSLFPSIPLDLALVCLDEYFVELKLGVRRRNTYLNIAKTCMENTCFQFRDNFYKQLKGLSMGNPLSPFLANVFMSSMERKLSSSTIFPRVWHRYVDNIIVVIQQDKMNDTLNFINSYHPTINFTPEFEIEGSLPFLELKINRDYDTGGLSFKIYRKPNSTNKYIDNKSFYCFQH